MGTYLKVYRSQISGFASVVSRVVHAFPAKLCFIQKKSRRNFKMTRSSVYDDFNSVGVGMCWLLVLAWIAILILRCGDVHANAVPANPCRADKRVTSLSDSNATDTFTTASGASTEEVFTVCPFCDYRSRNQQALWQHINAEHISHHKFPKIDFFTSHRRRICCICGLYTTKCGKLVADQPVLVDLVAVEVWRIRICFLGYRTPMQHLKVWI